ncbi:uncharacterized protein rtv [Chelonus insularis]|uniref:uncharacterized protein rtv n=1 Tax=Chelonus insularis TaxID=460826 RepID=UPI00158A5E63|nr:uncharacterized protein LOC118071627 [Chelonus insularis]
MLFLIIILNILYYPLTISIYESSLIKTYCRDSDRLIVTNKLDKYLLIDVELNTTLLLNCHFCGESNYHQPRLWYFQDRFQETNEREVEFDMNNNNLENKIYLNPDFDLIIKDFDIKDAGIYKCHGKLGEDSEKRYNYRLEPVFQDNDAESIPKGNLSDLKGYMEINLIPVTERFAVSRMPDLALVREAGVTLEVISELSAWSPCEKCINKHGLKTSKAQCRLKATINEDAFDTNKIVKFFDNSPLLPCRSHILNDYFPVISKIIRHLPEFLIEKKCKSCKKQKKPSKKDKFKYKKRFILLEGAHLAITCPESDLNSIIIWKRNEKILKTSFTSLFRKKKDIQESRILVDAFSTLYLNEVTIEEEGNYTCYVNDIKMMQVKIRVVSKSRLFNAGVLRRCVSCRSRGELGSCKDPFTMNSTQIDSEHGVEARVCGSGWCSKIIESPNLNNEYGEATERKCLQRGPDDDEERCAYTMINNLKVYMCFCKGDLCNHTDSLVASSFLILIANLLAIRH